MRHLALAATVVAALCSTGCNTLWNLPIEDPIYRLREVRPRIDLVVPLSASSIDLTFDVDVENPNRVGLTLDRMDFEVFVNGNALVRDVSTQNVRIPAQGIGNVDLRVRVGYDQVRTLWTEVVNLIQGDRAQYEIRGTAFYDTPLGELQFPLTLYRSGR